MQNITSTVMALVITILLILVAPMITLTERNDDVVQEKVKQLVEEFVIDVRNTGVLTISKYSILESRLATTGNTYDIEIELQILDENPGKKGTQTNVLKIGENLYYTEYTSQVLSRLESGDIQLKEGDYIHLYVKNQNKTFAQRMNSKFWTFLNEEQYVISADSSGMIIVNYMDKEM